MAKTAIDESDKESTQAAFFVLREDVLRMRSNTLQVQAALVMLDHVSDAVDNGDWDAACKDILALREAFGRP